MSSEQRKQQIWDEACHRYADSKMRNIFVAAAEWADSHPHWIPVEEKLPEENQRVRAWSLENNEEYLCDYHDGIFEDFYGPFTDGKITHWMPIGPPRKEDKE